MLWIDESVRIGRVKWSSRPKGPVVGSTMSLRSTFHTPSCDWAKLILPKNKVEYRTRSQAVGAKRKPCHTCRP
jgi:hypothetical protein